MGVGAGRSFQDESKASAPFVSASDYGSMTHTLVASRLALRSSLLVPTQVVERIEYRIDFLLGIWINVFETANQRDIFGT